MVKSKYAPQIKNLRKNYVRFPLDLKPEILSAFRSACAEKGTTPTTEIKRFITEYIQASESKGKPGEQSPGFFTFPSRWLLHQPKEDMPVLHGHVVGYGLFPQAHAGKGTINPAML